MLHAKVLRSPHAHARVVSIDASAARGMPGVHAVLTRYDLDGLSPVYGYFIKDQPIVAIDKVRYIGDVVAAVAAQSEQEAVAALETINVEYELLPAVTTVEQAMENTAPELFEDEPMGIVPDYGTGASGYRRIGRNNCYRFAYETGDASAAFASCDHVFVRSDKVVELSRAQRGTIFVVDEGQESHSPLSLNPVEELYFLVSLLAPCRAVTERAHN